MTQLYEGLVFLAVVSILLLIYLLVVSHPLNQQETEVGDIIPGCRTIYEGDMLRCGGGPDAVKFK